MPLGTCIKRCKHTRFLVDTNSVAALRSLLADRFMKTLIEIQEQYVETLNAGIVRWSHRKDGGHTSRISRGARHTAEKSLRKLGFTEQQIPQLIQDARDMAALERNALVDVSATVGQARSKPTVGE